MKRIFFVFGAAAVIALSSSSCASQRDCQGRYHTKLSNGIVI